MSAKVIAQNHKKVMALPKRSSSLSQANALTDQALMNFTYETMPNSDYNKSKVLVLEMMDRFREIKGF